MNYIVTKLSSFRVVGIYVKTSNLNGVSEKDIAALWKRFILESVSASIPNRESEDIYCLYTQYAGDDHENYMTVIGHKINGSLELTENLIELDIPDAAYFEFDSSGKQSVSVLKTWKDIWSNNYPRAYNSDFEIYYNNDSKDKSIQSVKTFLSVKM